MKTVRWGLGGSAAVLVRGGFNRSALDFAPLSLRNARRCFAEVLAREEAVIRAAGAGTQLPERRGLAMGGSLKSDRSLAPGFCSEIAY